MELHPINCPNCGSSVPNRTFCRDCGARLAPQTCRYCGHAVDGHSTFCSECGEALRANEAKTASPPNAPMSPDAGGPLPSPFTSIGASSGWLRRGAPAPTAESSADPSASSEQWTAYAPQQTQTHALPTYATLQSMPESMSEAAAPLTSPVHGHPLPQVPRPSGRLKAAAKGVGALMAILAAIVFFAAGGAYFDNHLPHKTDLSTALFGLTMGALWLGGGIWLVKRASWAWAAAWWLLWPATLPLYIYKSARGGNPRATRGFPTLWTSSGIMAVAAAMFIAGAAFSSNPIAPKQVDAESADGQAVAMASDELTWTSTPELMATEANAEPSANVTKTPGPTKTARPTKTATAEPTKTPRPPRLRSLCRRRRPSFNRRLIRGPSHACS